MAGRKKSLEAKIEMQKETVSKTLKVSKQKKNKSVAMSESKVSVNNDNSFRMLEYFQNEFYYRHAHFWRTLKLLFIFNSIITLLPFVSTTVGVELPEDINGKFRIIFPVFGLAVAVVTWRVLDGEAKRINFVQKRKYLLIDTFPEPYQYIKYADQSLDKNYLSKNIATMFFVFQIIIGIASIVLLIFL